MKQKANPLWLRTFLSYLLLFFLLFETAVVGILWTQHNSNKKRYNANLTTHAETVYSAMQAVFTNLAQTGGSIFSTRWYNHFRHFSGFYDDEFNASRRMEITSDLLSKTYAFEFLQDLLVITPSRDSVITKTGWFSMETFKAFFPDVEIILPETNQKPAQVRPTRDTICVMVLEDMTNRYDKTVICLLLDKARFASYLDRFLTEDTAYAQVRLRENVLYSRGEENDSNFTITKRLTSVPGDMVLSWPSYTQATMPQQLRTLALLSAIALLGAALVAIAIAYRSISPLRQIISRVGLSEEQTLPQTYAMLDTYIETVSDRNQQLLQENNTLNSTIARYAATQDSELLFQLLTNPDFTLQEGHIFSSMPWIARGLPYLLVVINAESDASLDRDLIPFASLYEGSAHHKMFSLLRSEYYVVLWYGTRESAQENRNRLAGVLSGLAPLTTAVSRIQDDPSEIASTLLALKEEMEQTDKENTSLPVLFQIQLITGILKGDMETTHSLLTDAQAKCSARAIFHFLTHVAEEYNVDVRCFEPLFTYHRAQGNTAEKWNVLTLMANEIAGGVNTVKHADSEETAAIIRQFIDNNYTDHNLSIRMLSDRFQMSESVISKLFKEKNGVSFSKYLQTLRIEKARSLLETESTSVASIGEAVGFISYLTFKRTFLRVQGITPVEYRALFRTEDTEPEA